MDGQLSIIDMEMNVGENKNDTLIQNVGEIDIISIEDGKSVTDFLKPVAATLDAKKFIGDFDDQVDKAYEYIISLQSNENPLKKGDLDITFKPETLILANKQTYTAQEDCLFDLLLALVATKPDEKVYQITASEAINFFPYYSPKYVYEILEKGHKGLIGKPIKLKIKNENNPHYYFNVSGVDKLLYQKKGIDNVDVNTLTFVPTKFFRLLAISSGIMHGAHYRISVSSGITSGYVKSLFVLLESKKLYRAYPGASVGEFIVYIDELKDYLNIPESYKTNDLRRCIIDKLKNEITKIPYCDIDFTYEPVYETIKGTRRTKCVGFRFKVTQIIESKILTASKDAIEDKQELKEDNPENNNEDVLKSAIVGILKGAGFDDDDIKKIIKKNNEYKRDIVFITQAIMRIEKGSNIKSRVAAMLNMLENGIWEKEKDIPKKNAANQFNNFNQRTYDFDELEKKLINNK